MKISACLLDRFAWASSQNPQRYLIKYAYLGTRYHGLPAQVGLKTVGGTLEDAVESVCGVPGRHFHSSRTDRGVSALGNASHVDVPQSCASDGTPITARFLFRQLNAHLWSEGERLRIQRVKRVNLGFNARHHPSARLYTYRLLRVPPAHTAVVHRALRDKRLSVTPSSRIPPGVIDETALPFTPVKASHDFDAFAATLHLFNGQVDLSNFITYNQGKTTSDEVVHRVMETKCERTKMCPSLAARLPDDVCRSVEQWCVHFSSKGYVYHQLRWIVGAALSVSKGRLPLEWVMTLLRDTDPSSRPSYENRKFKPAIAPGLFLHDVVYRDHDLKFRPEKESSLLEMGFPYFIRPDPPHLQTVL